MRMVDVLTRNSVGRRYRVGVHGSDGRVALVSDIEGMVRHAARSLEHRYTLVIDLSTLEVRDGTRDTTTVALLVSDIVGVHAVSEIGELGRSVDGRARRHHLMGLDHVLRGPQHARLPGCRRRLSAVGV